MCSSDLAGRKVGELCFNTSMTGYQEIMTDPSYAAQIVTFTFPHIGNVGANYEDLEADNPFALGCIVRQDVTEPSNFRSERNFIDWMRANNRIGLSGVDTRALTRKIREQGAPNGVIAYHDPSKICEWSGGAHAASLQRPFWLGIFGYERHREWRRSINCRCWPRAMRSSRPTSGT